MVRNKQKLAPAFCADKTISLKTTSRRYNKAVEQLQSACAVSLNKKQKQIHLSSTRKVNFDKIYIHMTMYSTYAFAL